MESEGLFELLEILFLTLSAYWGIKVSSETLTYVRVRGFLLVLPLIFTLTFKYLGFLASFALLLLFFLIEGVGVILAMMGAIFAFVLFLIGAMVSTIALGILGTYLHVPGYEMHGTIEELLHRAVMR